VAKAEDARCTTDTVESDEELQNLISELEVEYVVCNDGSVNQEPGGRRRTRRWADVAKIESNRSEAWTGWE